MSWVNNISGADLSVYLKDGRQINLELSTEQLIVMLKIIGFEFGEDGNSYTCFSDVTLCDLMKMKGNPLRLQKHNEEEK